MVIGLVGGGTAGHFYPLISVSEYLNSTQNRPDLYYFGPSPYNKNSLKESGIKYVYCPAGKLRRYFSMQNFLDFFKNFFGIFVAIWKLYIIYPDVIFSKGGYTSVPVLLAARFLRIPVVIHESDAFPGRANLLSRNQAQYVGIAYKEAAKYFSEKKTALVGIPLRHEIKEKLENPLSSLGIPNDKPLIYITGGSQGAERINNLVIMSLSTLLPEYRIFHQVGAGNINELRLTAKSLLENSPLQNDYYIEGTLNSRQVSALMQAADLIITRAGSTALFEISYHQKPSIVIPIPEDISRDQRSNAYAYARRGGATVIEEHNLSPNLLKQEIDFILKNENNKKAMSAAAARFYIAGAEEKISNLLISIGQEHGSH